MTTAPRPTRPDDEDGLPSEPSTAALFTSVYQELRAVAARYLRRERGDHTLAATALVHEAFLKVSSIDDGHWQDREHFLAVATRAIRRVLATHAERRGTARRGGHLLRIAGEPDELPNGRRFDVVELHDALQALERLDPRQARIAELRFLGGLSVAETARALGISERTVVAEWAHGRAWLRRQMGPERGARRSP